MLAPDPLDPEQRFQSLAEYLVSLARLRNYKPTLVHGGHGEPVTDFEEIFNRYIRAIDDRQKRVLSLLSNSSSTAYSIARDLFPNSFEHGVHRYLAISEAIAHLDYAHSSGKVELELDGGIEHYRL